MRLLKHIIDFLYFWKKEKPKNAVVNVRAQIEDSWDAETEVIGKITASQQYFLKNNGFGVVVRRMGIVRHRYYLYANSMDEDNENIEVCRIRAKEAYKYFIKGWLPIRLQHELKD